MDDKLKKEIINFRGLKVRGFLNKFISKACELTLLRAAENPTLNLPPMPRKTVIAKAFIPALKERGFLLTIIKLIVQALDEVVMPAIDDLEQKMDQRFEKMDQRFDGMDSKLDRVIDNQIVSNNSS